MSESDERIERAIRKVIGDPGPNPGPNPRPDPGPNPVFNPSYPYEPCSVSEPAIARCRDAWKKAYDAYMEKNVRKEGSMAKGYARDEAAAAYRAAMPQLASWLGIRDFIACVAYGLLTDAIPPDRSGQLLYAAQTALSLLPRIPNC
jgi:hypothetical protein